MSKQPDFHMYSGSDVAVFISHKKREVTVHMKVKSNRAQREMISVYTLNYFGVNSYNCNVIPRNTLQA